MRIIDRDHKPPVQRKIHRKPIQAMQDSKRRVLGSRLTQLTRQQRPSPRRRTREQLDALPNVGTHQPPLKQLTYDPKRERGLKLGPTGAQHLAASLRRPRARGLEQRCLADPGPTLNEQNGPPFNDRLGSRKLTIALQEHQHASLESDLKQPTTAARGHTIAAAAREETSDEPCLRANRSGSARPSKTNRWIARKTQRSRPHRHA